jgi:hypothetical protein
MLNALLAFNKLLLTLTTSLSRLYGAVILKAEAPLQFRPAPLLDEPKGQCHHHYGGYNYRYQNTHGFLTFLWPDWATRAL